MQRVRDPLHNLIEFSDSELERTLWKVVQTRPFQRLRRIKQLGFSDLVYPGASHSRFAHSIGVFHTARQLMSVVQKHVSQPQNSKERRALAASLVHDLGHGPFSHSFEKVGKRLNLRLANHEIMSDALIRSSEVTSVLNELGSGFASDVADIIQKGGVKTVEHAVVSSQFDADRLDYMRRDRLMTGTEHAAIDFDWLIANLEIASLPEGVDESPVGNVETFVLAPKAIHAAEAYVLGLFQLYPTIYFHKATRGIENIFAELLVRLVHLVKNNATSKTGLPKTHPLIRFARAPDNIDTALLLDDAVIWGSLSQLADASDPLIAEFATRLRDRKLLKCQDVRTHVSHALNPKGIASREMVEAVDRCCAEINKALSEWLENTKSERVKALIDADQRSPYKPIGQSKGPLDRINVRTDGGALVDLQDRSSVVAALETFKLLRVYIDRDDSDTQERVRSIVDTEIERCRTAML